MFHFFSKIWSSPTLMTWGSFFSQSTSLLVLLPLILTRLSTEEIAIWYLFMTLIGFQRLADLGFSPTFSRVLAFSMGGATVDDLRLPKGRSNGQCNEESIERIYMTMRYIYTRLGVVWTLVLGGVGTLALQRPVSMLSSPNAAWLAWGLVLLFSYFTFRGNIYAAILQGVNKVALLRRCEMIVTLLTMGAMAVSLLMGGQILGLVAVHQVGRFVNVLLNWFLTTRTLDIKCLKVSSRACKDYQVFSAVWPSAWRSGLGKFMSYGFIQGSGLVYAQLGSVEAVATYLLTLRLFDTISQFSQAPFYSRLPVMARFFSEGRRDELLLVAQRGMRWSYWSFVLSFVCLAVLGSYLLDMIGSNAEFPDPEFWGLWGAGYFVERYGAMHIQLYSNTNHIVWHTACGVTGLIFLFSSIVLFPFVGIYSFPFGFIMANVGFYSWYCSMHSYREYKVNIIQFEKKGVFFPFLALVVFFVSSCYIQFEKYFY